MVTRLESVISLHPDSLPAHLRTQLAALKAKFKAEADVRNAETGFIWVAFMNKPPHIDSGMLEVQAAIIAHTLRHTKPTRIIGIPTSGIPLAEQVVIHFPDAAYVPTRKLTDPHDTVSDWPNAAVFDVFSFTRQANMRMAIKRVEPGERYLVADDVAAWGHASKGFFAAIGQNGGIPVGFGVGFEKQFQAGIRTVAVEFNIPSVAVVTVAGIQNGKVILA